MQLTGAIDRLVSALGRRACCKVALLDASARPWASRTFSGARHRLTLRFDPDCSADTMLSGLEDCQFDLGGEILVDIVPVERKRDPRGETVVVEALLIDAD